MTEDEALAIAEQVSKLVGLFLDEAPLEQRGAAIGELLDGPRTNRYVYVALWTLAYASVRLVAHSYGLPPDAPFGGIKFLRLDDGELVEASDDVSPVALAIGRFMGAAAADDAPTAQAVFMTIPQDEDVRGEFAGRLVSICDGMVAQAGRHARATQS